MNTSNILGKGMKRIEKKKEVVLESFDLYAQMEFGQIFPRSRTRT